MSFLGSVFGGQNKTLNQQIPMLSSMAGGLSKSGTTGMNDAMSYFHNILNGDYSSLSPQFAAIHKQGGQQMQQAFNFGNRSGGTNASIQTLSDKMSASTNDLINGAKSNAASSIGGLGSTMLGLGLQSSNMAVNDSQMQMDNYLNSILGQGLQMGAGFLEGKGLGRLGKS